VALNPSPCNNLPAEIWEVFKLQPRPDGTLTGEHTRTGIDNCAEKRTVTFTRTGDVVVNKLPDPAALPPRVVSPAEALRGRYQLSRTFTMGVPSQMFDQTVSTDCLRTGDRCMSYLYGATSDSPLLFVGGAWISEIAHTTDIPGCGPTQLHTSAQYPLPQPLQNPITVLTGHGHHEQSGSACATSIDFDETITRTGD
jgi:serine/threonine-protein kinase